MNPGIFRLRQTGDAQTVDTDSLSGSGEFTCVGDILTTALIDEAYPDGIEATFDRIA